MKYIKPLNCPIPDEQWNHALGICWGFKQTVDDIKRNPLSTLDSFVDENNICLYYSKTCGDVL